MSTRKMIVLLLVFILIGFMVVGCNSGDAGKEPGSNEANGGNEVNGGQNEETLEYLLHWEDGLSYLDVGTAFKMCEKALNDYHRAIWNGEPIDLDLFIENANLKQYLDKQIQDQYTTYGKKNTVTDVKVSIFEAQHITDAGKNYIYLKLPIAIVKSIGETGEVFEFIVDSSNDKLVIADWYNASKDSYDFLVRGEGEQLDNPEVWKDEEWTRELFSKQ